MNKKIIIIVLIILGVVLVSGCIGSSELVINNVAGVNNVKLPSENFTASYIEGGDDNYHNANGDMSIGYNPTGSGITFYNTTNEYNETSFYSESGYVFNDSYSTTEPIVIAGIKGYYSHDVDLGDSFFFVMNNKVYMISITNGTLTDNLVGVEFLLKAWLEASGYKQTWDYPNETTSTNHISNDKKTSNNNSLADYEEPHPPMDREDNTEYTNYEPLPPDSGGNTDNSDSYTSN